MPVARLKELLEREHVDYACLNHPTAFTAQEIAASAHVKGKELAKTVMVKIDGKMAMAVLPATARVDLGRLKKAAGAKTTELATEAEFERLFPNCQPGAMPPFGNLYGMPVFAEKGLAEDEEIAFNAGTHSELIRLAYRDFERLVQPTVAAFAVGRS